MTRKRVAVVARRVSGLSGATRTIIEQSRRAAAHGWDVHVFGRQLDRKALREAGASSHWVPSWPWGSWLKRRTFAAAAGRMAAGFDLVHGHGDLLDQDVLTLHNCVHTAHEAAHGAPLSPENAVGRMHALQLQGGRFRALAANSHLMKNDVTRRFGVPPERVHVIYPGFDPRLFAAADRARFGAAMRAELGVHPGVLLYGLVTSGDFEKRGLKPFLRSFAGVSRKIPAARAVVVGKEARLAPYLDLARELGIADRVVFREPIPEVWRFYHALDVYVHPARWEEFGMTILEALACGVPVITSAGVGAAELMTGEARDFVLADPSGEELAFAMLALADQVRRARVAALGPDAARPCEWDRVASELLKLYDSIAS